MTETMIKESLPADSEPRPRRVLAAATAVAAVGVTAYLNSFRCHFIFDDFQFIGNRETQSLWPPWPAMFSLRHVSRPLIGLSLAINHSISGYDVWSYHALNLCIHILAALALFGVVRRTLLTPALRERFGERSTELAAAVALIWVAHPLQTQAVTYIIQRCESLMGLFYLLTLYCAIRSFDSSRKRFWIAAAVVACGAGMLSKEVMITAPLAVLLYDGLFLSGSLTGALRKRSVLYAGLVGAWSLLAATHLAAPVNETAGFAVTSISPWRYLVSEFGVITHYLRLALWPNNLVLDYGWPVATTASGVLPYAVFVGALAAGAIWAFLRRKPVGFIGVWFFLILSVTSSFIPFKDLAFEHRMYLPLAAVVTMAVLGSYVVGASILRRFILEEQQRLQTGRAIALVIVTLVVASAVFLTLRRNIDYQDSFAIWNDVIRKRPENSRAYSNLGRVYIARRNYEGALICFAKACEYDERSWVAQSNLGEVLVSLGKTEEGKGHLLEALRLRPSFEFAHYNLGRVLAAEGQFEEAIAHFSQALETDPNHAQAYCARGLAQSKKGNAQAAISDYYSAARIDPNWFEPLTHLAVALALQDDPRLRNIEEASRLAEQAVAITKEQEPAALDALAIAYAESGRFPEAAQLEQKAFDLAVKAKSRELLAVVESRLRQYRTGRVWRPPTSDLSTKTAPR